MSQLLTMTNAEYHAHAALSRSKLMDYYKSARKFKAIESGEIDGTKETEAMRLGSFVHALVFEPDEAGKVVTIPEDILSSDGKATTKAARLFVENNADKTCITAKSYEAGIEMADNLMCSSFGRWLEVKGARKETNIIWTDAETGLELRARPDLLLPSTNGLLAIDLKTTSDASPAGFRYSCKSFGYWMQYAHYCDGIEAAFGERPHEWYFVAVNSEPPYEVAIHRFTPITKATAVERYRATLRQFAESRESNVWRSEWETAINDIELRDWDF